MDIVWVGTLLTTVTAIVGFFVYLRAVITRHNGTYSDAYVCVLLLAFACNYGYLWWARDMMYRSSDKYKYLITRTDYFPLVYFVWLAMLVMIIHKVVDMRDKK